MHTCRKRSTLAVEDRPEKVRHFVCSGLVNEKSVGELSFDLSLACFPSENGETGDDEDSWSVSF